MENRTRSGAANTRAAILLIEKLLEETDEG